MPLAVAALVMTGAEGAIVTVSGALAVPMALVACRVRSNSPELDGVPEIRPVVAFKVKPSVRPEAVKLAGWFVARIW